MNSEIVLAVKFVEYIPERLDDRTLYVSKKYGTAVHKCCCGCGREVVTPLKPTGWELECEGSAVSLYPSIGNWSMPCQSHYWITRNKVVWAPQWSKEEIERGRAEEALAKERHFAGAAKMQERGQVGTDAGPAEPAAERRKESIWRRLTKWLWG